jgi:hypothetical protein
MIGGIVIEVAELADRVFVDVRDRRRKDTCAIYVEKDENSKRVRIGDTIWWQGGYAMWTPASVRDGEKGRSDIKINRIGYSGVALPNRPEGHSVAGKGI